MMNINEILKKMNWNNDNYVQLEGRKEAEQLSDLSLLIRPKCDKETWENLL